MFEKQVMFQGRHEKNQGSRVISKHHWCDDRPTATDTDVRLRKASTQATRADAGSWQNGTRHRRRGRDPCGIVPSSCKKERERQRDGKRMNRCRTAVAEGDGMERRAGRFKKRRSFHAEKEGVSQDPDRADGGRCRAASACCSDRWTGWQAYNRAVDVIDGERAGILGDYYCQVAKREGRRGGYGAGWLKQAHAF